MSPFLVVLQHPLPGNLSDLVQTSEQIDIQHLGSIRAVEALDVGILIWLARFDVVDEDPIGPAPFGELRKYFFSRGTGFGPHILRDTHMSW